MRGGDGLLPCARVARVMGRRTRHDTLSLSWKRFSLSGRALFCVSLHRCGDAPIPAALVSSLLPFDAQHTQTHTSARPHGCTHRYTSGDSERRSPALLWCLCRFSLMLVCTHTRTFFTISQSLSIMSGNLLNSAAFMIG